MHGTGERKAVKDTPFDFREETTLSPRLDEIDGGGEPGIDHTFVLDTDAETKTSRFGLPYCGTLKDQPSGRLMNIYTSEPGVQVYTGNFLSKEASDAPFTQHNAICMECQRFPNTINEPSFGNAILEPSAVYTQELVHEFVTV
jgi:aldose 1-epimerase